MPNKNTFFTKEVKEKIKKTIDQSTLCKKCGLYKNCITPKMKPTGKGKKKILIIAEAPGKTEDLKGIQLVGFAGQLLRELLFDVDIDLDQDCWKTNAIICRPPGNKTPTIAQINHCRNYLLETIEKYKPEKILTFGTVALQSLIGKKISVTGISKWIKWIIPDQEYKCWIFPNYHPQYLNYNEKDIILKKIFRESLQTAIEWNEEFPEIDLNNEIHISKNKQEILNFFKLIKEGDTIVFDFETTGLKPHKKGHQIICMSVDLGYTNLSFPILDDEIKNEIKKILSNKHIKKIAHNLKFEHQWSKIILGIDVQGWCWDTMIAAHVIDNRTGITGLKFQIYVNFGIAGYEKNIEKYIVSKSKSGNAFNKINEYNMDELLFYCGTDSYFTKKLADKQMDIISEMKQKRQNAMYFFLEGIIELSKLKGVHFDYKQYKKNNKILDKKLKILNEKIRSSNEVELLKLENNEEFNFKSTKQLRYLLYDVLEWKTDSKTATGLNSTDKETLENFNEIFTNTILKYRYVEKIKNTYLAQFEREMIEKDGTHYIYPNFNLNTVVTYRSSSSRPNFQNIPIRDKFAGKMTRTCIIPKKGYKLLEIDYSGIEVCVSACYHKDPVMIDYINNPDSDMHRDIAIDLFKLNLDECTKELRYLAKNGFVFPQFYGDYWENCAKNIWNRLSDEQKIFLKEKGFKRYGQFENHVKEVEDYFWNERFKVYTKWKERTYKKYLKLGYVEMKTGFRCYGPMKRNDVLNYPIQGAAFHLLLWSLIQLNKQLREKQMNSCIIGQIHDSIVLDIDPMEESVLKIMIRQIMCKDILEHFKWIIVSLDIEAEITEIDASWHTKKETKI